VIDPKPTTLTDEERERLLAPTGDEGFELLWAKVTESWDEEKCHAAFVEYAITQRLMPEAAGRYRVMRTEEAKRAVADKRLNTIVVAATFMLEETRTVSPERTHRALSIVGFVVSIALLGWLASVVFRH
jgi:hypothetical protein